MKLIVTNAFSLNMLAVNSASTAVQVHPISKARARQALDAYEETSSAVGHADTAKVFSAELGVEIPFVRSTIQLWPDDDRLLVGQYKGPRLPEGATTLPEGATIEWFIIEVKKLTNVGLNTLIDPQACCYCGRSKCIAVTHGESICG